MTPTVLMPWPRAMLANSAASVTVEIMGAMTQGAMPVRSCAAPSAASCVSSSSGLVRTSRNARTPSAGFSSSGWVTNARGLSAPASMVRMTTLRPSKARSTAAYTSVCSASVGAVVRSR